MPIEPVETGETRRLATSLAAPPRLAAEGRVGVVLADVADGHDIRDGVPPPVGPVEVVDLVRPLQAGRAPVVRGHPSGEGATAFPVGNAGDAVHAPPDGGRRRVGVTQPGRRRPRPSRHYT